MPKTAVFTVKLESDLRDAFLAEAESTHRPASQLVRDFMREFIDRRREAREHETWFRSEVEGALTNPQPGVSNDAVMDQISSVIDHIVAEQERA